MIKGIDVSRWQGIIDWPSVASDGVKFAIIKATEGLTHVDPNLDKNAVGAYNAGLKIGFYHFLRPDNSEPEREAQHFVNKIRDYPYEWLVCDIEDKKGKDNKWVIEYTKRWLLEVERLTRVKPIVYTYVSFAKNVLGKSLVDYPLWIAHYVSGSPGTTAWTDWVCWQYTSAGRVKGISGNVDLNWMKEDFFMGSGKAKTRFKDVPAGHWAEEAIKYVDEVGLMKGYPDDTFGVGKFITREELAVILYRLKGGDKA